MAKSTKYSRSIVGGSDETREIPNVAGINEIYNRLTLERTVEAYSTLVLDNTTENSNKLMEGGPEDNHSISAMGGSDEDHSRSFFGGSDIDHSRSVSGGSNADHNRFVTGSSDGLSRSALGGSDEGHNKSMFCGSDKNHIISSMGGTNEDDSRPFLRASNEDPCRSVMAGSNKCRSRNVLGDYDEDLNRSVGDETDENRLFLGGIQEDYNRAKLSVIDKSQHSRSMLDAFGEDDIRLNQCGSEDQEDHIKSALGWPYNYHSRSMLGGSDQDDRVQVSDSTSSDEQIANCYPCQRAGNRTVAVKYCEECLHYLCVHCYNIHMRYFAFQQHVLHEVNTKVIRKKAKDAQPSALTTADIVCSIAVSTPKDKKYPMLWGIAVSTPKDKEYPMLWGIAVSTPKDKEYPVLWGIAVSTPKDKEYPMLWCIAVVRSKFCVVTDWKNKSIKVVDTEMMRITSEKRVERADKLSSITAVNDDDVAVSISIKGVAKVLFYSVSKTGVVKDTHKSFDTSNHFFSMTYSKDRLYATDGSHIYVLSLHGDIVKTIRNRSFDTLFGTAISNDDNIIYVGSLCNDTVFSLDLDGNIKASYTDTDLKRPYGISVDSKCFVYVCSYRKGSVHQLTADLKQVQVILKDDGVEDCDINKTTNNLYLSYDNKIKVYDLRHL